MQMETHYSYALLRDFFRFGVLRKKKGGSRIPLVLAMLTVSIAGSVVFILENKLRGVFIGVLALMAVVLALLVYMWFFRPRAVCKQNPALTSAVNLYDFDARDFTVSLGGTKKTVRYADLLKVVERPAAFYLYVSETGAYIVDKTENDPENCERLSALLFHKCKDRYILRKR